jgi:hypothetical protein
MDLADLTVEECPLLRTSAGLREAFNRVAAQARLVNQHLGEVLDRPMPPRRKGDQPRTFPEALAEVRRSLTQQHYQVGFLGTTGAGKSTTLNGVLGNPPEPPGEPGGGQATTSTVMRLRAVANGDHRMVLRYLTSEQYAAKREALAAKVGFERHMNEQTILGLLPALRADLAAGQLGIRPGDAGSPVRPGDVDYLEQMIRAYLTAEGRSRVAHGGQDKEVPYASRRQYLNYSSQSDAYNRLIRETVVEFNTEVIPPELEMVDLPGLSASTSVDSLVTTDYLEDLDGAFVFFRSDKLSDSDAEELLLRLRSRHGSLVGRVWVVVTKIDGLTKPQLVGNQIGSSLLTGLQDIHRKYGVPLDQFHLVSNDFLKLSPDQVAGVLKRKIDSDDPVPPLFRGDPALRAAFESLMDQGGIPRLRRLVSAELARRVEERVRAAAQAELSALSDYLTASARTEARRLGQGKDARGHCLTVRKRVQEIIITLDDEHGGFEAEAERISGILEAEFGRLCLSAKDIEKLRAGGVLNIAQDFHQHSEDLHRTFHDELETNTLPTLYGRVQAALDEHPQVPVLSYPDGQAAAWRQFATEDRAPAAPWRRRLPGFVSDTLFPPGGNGKDAAGTLDGYGYHEVMHEKIEAVGQQAVYSVRRQIRSRLKSLIDELDRVMNSTPRGAGGATTQFDEVLAQLEALGQEPPS